MVDLGQPREVLGARGVERVSLRPASSVHAAVAAALLERDRLVRGQPATMSALRRPGSTHRPGVATSASSGTRTEISMSVAESSAGPSADSATIRMPERICTLERAERPRLTSCSFWFSSDWEQVIFMRLVYPGKASGAMSLPIPPVAPSGRSAPPAVAFLSRKDQLQK